MTVTARQPTAAQTDSRSHHDRWPLTRILMFLLANAFVGLAMEIRVEHVDAVHEQGVAWTPIVYSCVMAVACLVAFVFWNKTSRRLMLPLFLLSFVVGGMGFYFHNHGNLRRVIKTSVNAWTNPNMNHSDGPPQMAPLAFGGLGVIGILTSLRRFNP
jgi:hypothetical protein